MTTGVGTPGIAGSRRHIC